MPALYQWFAGEIDPANAVHSGHRRRLLSALRRRSWGAIYGFQAILAEAEVGRQQALAVFCEAGG
jgi:hypothetical protein